MRILRFKLKKKVYSDLTFDGNLSMEQMRKQLSPQGLWLMETLVLIHFIFLSAEIPAFSDL